MKFNKWAIEAAKKDLYGDTPQGTFCEDWARDKKPRADFIWWEELEDYLAGTYQDVKDAAKFVFDDWAKLHGPIDGLNKKDIEHIRRVTRQVWGWSWPKKRCIARAKDLEGFPRCEKCKKRVPRIHVDHIKPVGLLDEGYFKRLYCPSTKLQALCLPCHKIKTKRERDEARPLGVNKLGTRKKKLDFTDTF
jgi:hypothetical protein